MASIDQFKAQLLGGGPRANRFRVFIPRSGNKIEFLCQSAQIPAAQVGVVEQQFRGHVLSPASFRTCPLNCCSTTPTVAAGICAA